MSGSKIEEQQLHGIVGTEPNRKTEDNKDDELPHSVSEIKAKTDMRSWRPRRPSETIHADSGSRLFHLRRLSDA